MNGIKYMYKIVFMLVPLKVKLRKLMELIVTSFNFIS